MKSSFPNSSQFSPTQTLLPLLLSVVKKAQPLREKIREDIASTFFNKSKDKKIPENTIFALSEYKLLEKPTTDITFAQLTPLGELLLEMAENGQVVEMYRLFADHILLELHGLELIQCVDDLTLRGTKITKETISKELVYRGYHVPNNGTHLNGMRQWLEQSGLVEKGKWVANQKMLSSILGGISNTEIDEFAQLSNEQRAFAKALARLGVDEANLLLGNLHRTMPLRN